MFKKKFLFQNLGQNNFDPASFNINYRKHGRQTISILKIQNLISLCHRIVLESKVIYVSKSVVNNGYNLQKCIDFRRF